MFDGIREECDLTVFLDAPETLLLARRLERDTTQRGYSVERVMRLLPELRRDYEKFIEPMRGMANIVLDMGKMIRTKSEILRRNGRNNF